MEKLSKEFDPKKFKHPTYEYYPYVFWFLNGKINEKTIKRQLIEMKDKGIFQPVIVPWKGLTIEYLSDEWIEHVKCICKLAKELGLTLILYDELNWPSGYAGGKLLKANPEYRAKCLSIREIEIHGPVICAIPKIFAKFSQVVIAARIAPNLTISDLIDLTEKLDCGNKSFYFPLGKWKVMFFRIEEGNYQPPFSKSYYTDLLNKDAVKMFISLTHEKYYKKIPEYFGSVIKGVFTDEPGMYFNVWWFNPASIPWTSDFFNEFKKRKGYDLREYLPVLWYSLDDEARTTKIRVDFFDVLASLYQEAYFKSIHKWCVKHDVFLMGHILSEEDLRFTVRLEADFFKVMRNLEIPGVDYIGGWDKKALTPKMGSSAAHAFNKPVVFSETFALFGWDLTLEVMKAVTDWLFVRGINKQLISGFFYSIKGKRKHCVPPSVYQNTFWPYFRNYTDYTARLSYMLTNGRHVAPIAILIPTATMQSKISASDLSYASKLQTLLENISNFLLENQYDFDYVNESLFSNFSIVNKPKSYPRIRLGNEEYAVLILLGNKVISRETLKAVENFKRKGGTIISLGEPPTITTDGTYINKNIFITVKKPKRLLGILRKFRDVEVLNHKGERFEVFDELMRGGRANEGYVAPLREGHELGLLFNVDADFFDEVGCDVAIGGWVKCPDKSSVLKLKTELPDVTLTLKKNGPKGKIILSKKFEKIATSRLLLKFKPLPKGKYYLQMTDAKGDIGWWSRDFNEDNKTVAYADGKKVLGHDRTLYLRTINYTTNAPFINYLHLIRDNHDVYFVTNSAPFDVDLLMAFYTRGTPELFDSQNGKIKKCYEFIRKRNSTIVRLRLCRFGSIFVVFSKRKEVPCVTATNMLINKVSSHGDSLTVDATALQGGENFVEAQWMGKTYFSKTFAKDPKVVEISEWIFKAGKYKSKLKGEWSEIMPYYSGTGVYSQKFFIPKYMLQNKKIILTCKEVANILELEVNGKRVGVRCWAPYKFDITSYLKPGQNTIVISVTNTPANKIDHKKLPSGLLTPVQIHFYENYLMTLKPVTS